MYTKSPEKIIFVVVEKGGGEEERHQLGMDSENAENAEITGTSRPKDWQALLSVLDTFAVLPSKCTVQIPRIVQLHLDCNLEHPNAELRITLDRSVWRNFS